MLTGTTTTKGIATATMVTVAAHVGGRERPVEEGITLCSINVLFMYYTLYYSIYLLQILYDVANIYKVNSSVEIDMTMYHLKKSISSSYSIATVHFHESSKKPFAMSVSITS